MNLERIEITNLRCIDTMSIDVKNFTSLIGPNNAGKSTVLRAVEIFLNQLKPNEDEWRSGFETENITISGVFGDITTWEREKPGVSSLVHDDKIHLRMTASPISDEQKTITTEWECKKPPESITGWNGDRWSELDPSIQEIANGIDIDGKNFRSIANKEKLKQKIRNDHNHLVVIEGEPIWSTSGVSISPAFKQAIPSARLIPAQTDAAKDGAPGAGSSFTQILKEFILPDIEQSDEYRNLIKSVSDLEAKLQQTGDEAMPVVKDILNFLTNRLSSIIDSKVILSMDTPDSHKFIGSHTGLRLDDGTNTSIELQGHGLQRTFVFAMLEFLATKSAIDSTDANNSRNTVLLFEEPELFMHPHMMRQLKSLLVNISNLSNWQVLISTHSPFLINIGDDRDSLVIHKRPSANRPPSILQLSEDPLGDETKKEERETLRALLDFHPSVCEAFFAKNVILVEGDSELAVLSNPHGIFEIANLEENNFADTTVVSCRGKWTIVPIARLMIAFDIPLKVIHDEDKKNRTAEQLSTVSGNDPWSANTKISQIVPANSLLVVKDTLEDLLSTPTDKFTSSRDKPYRTWCKIRDISKLEDGLTQYQGLQNFLDFAVS